MPYLSNEQRRIVYQRSLDGETNREIAEDYGITTETVRNIYKRKGAPLTRRYRTIDQQLPEEKKQRARPATPKTYKPYPDYEVWDLRPIIRRR